MTRHAPSICFLKRGFFNGLALIIGSLTCPPEYPVWPVTAIDGQQPLSSLRIGEYIHCPMDPIGHSPLRIIGMNGKPYGFVCEECNAIYTTTDLALPMDSVPVRSKEMVYA